eukprot:UN14535
MVTIDKMVKEDNIYILKTDTQGYDYFAMQGATQTFKNSHVNIVHFEFWPRVLLQSNVTSTAVFDLIQNEFGMKTCFDVNEGGPLVRSYDTSSYIKFADTHLYDNGT